MSGFLLQETWYAQFTENVDCPEGIEIPIEDSDAYKLNPSFHWAYNKLEIAEKQGLRCAPHGLEPTHYPVFSKPIYNMAGMGVGSRVLNSKKEYVGHNIPGHMWCELLEGEHINTDVAVVDGSLKWFCHTKGFPLQEGTFDYWLVEDTERKDVVTYVRSFVEKNFKGYTGMMNFETIGGKIIEMHLRASFQWPDLYGSWYVPALVQLYGRKSWPTEIPPKIEGYSVVLFVENGNYEMPPEEEVLPLERTEGVSSIQLCFYENAGYNEHEMPPGGQRVAIINGTNLDICKMVREKLRGIIKKVEVQKNEVTEVSHPIGATGANQ